MLASVATDDQRGHDWQAIINAMFDRDVHDFHDGADGRVAAPGLSREQSGPEVSVGGVPVVVLVAEVKDEADQTRAVQPTSNTPRLLVHHIAQGVSATAGTSRLPIVMLKAVQLCIAVSADRTHGDHVVLAGRDDASGQGCGRTGGHDAVLQEAGDGLSICC